MREHFDERIVFIFKQMDADHNEKVTLEEYQTAVLEDPSLLDIFEFLKKGVTQTIREAELRKDQLILHEVSLINEQGKQIANHMLEVEMKHSNSYKPSLVSSLFIHVNKM